MNGVLIDRFFTVLNELNIQSKRREQKTPHCLSPVLFHFIVLRV